MVEIGSSMKIAHVSDTHISPYGGFLESVFDQLVNELNEMGPDVILHTGDVTDYGVLKEYKMARKRLKQIEPELVIIPGNHDSRNLGYSLFPEFFGSGHKVRKFDNIGIVALDTSVPDLDDGRLGRAGQRHLEDKLDDFQDLTKVVCLHHHLIPVPESGRERSLVDDAGEVLDLICKKNVQMVLMGHRHVPNVMRVENTLMVNAGTLSCTRTRGRHGHSFNFLSVHKREVKIERIRLIEDRIDRVALGSYKLL